VGLGHFLLELEPSKLNALKPFLPLVAETGDYIFCELCFQNQNLALWMRVANCFSSLKLEENDMCIYLPFDPLGMAGQTVQLISHNDQLVDILFDEKHNTVSFEGKVYSIGDKFLLFQKSGTILPGSIVLHFDRPLLKDFSPLESIKPSDEAHQFEAKPLTSDSFGDSSVCLPHPDCSVEREQNTESPEEIIVVLVPCIGMVAMTTHISAGSASIDLGSKVISEIMKNIHLQFSLKTSRNVYYLVNVSEDFARGTVVFKYTEILNGVSDSFEIARSALEASENIPYCNPKFEVLACRKICLDYLEAILVIERNEDIEGITLVPGSSAGSVSSHAHNITKSLSLNLLPLETANILSRHHRFVVRQPFCSFVVDMMDGRDDASLLIRYMRPLDSRSNSVILSSDLLSNAGIPNVNKATVREKVHVCREYLLKLLAAESKKEEQPQNDEYLVEECKSCDLLQKTADLQISPDNDLLSDNISVVLVATVGVVSMTSHQVSGRALLDFERKHAPEPSRAFHQKFAMKAPGNRYLVVDVCQGSNENSLCISFMGAIMEDSQSFEVSGSELQSVESCFFDDTAPRIAAYRELVRRKFATKDADAHTGFSVEEAENELLSFPCHDLASFIHHSVTSTCSIRLTPVPVANILSLHHRFAIKGPLHHYVVDMLEGWKKNTVLLRYIDPISSHLRTYEVSFSQMQGIGVVDINSADVKQKVEACKKILLRYLQGIDTAPEESFQLRCILKVIDKRYVVKAFETPNGGFSINYMDPLSSGMKVLAVPAGGQKLLGIHKWSASNKHCLKDACLTKLINARVSELILLWRGVMLIGGRRLLLHLIESLEPSSDAETEGEFYITVKWYDIVFGDFGELKVFEKDFKVLGFTCDMLLVPSDVKIETCASKLAEQALWQHLLECHSDMEEASAHGALGDAPAEFAIEDSFSFSENFAVVLVASVGMVSMTSHQPNNVISMDFGVLFSLEAAKGFHHRFALKGPNNHHYLIDVSPGVHEDNLKISYVEASHSKPESIEVSVAQLRQEGSFICDDTASKLAACRNFVIKLLTENFCSHEISLPETSLEDELIVSPCFGIVSFLHHFIVPATACPIRSVCIANVVSQHHRFALKAPLHHYIVDILEDWKEDKLLLRYMNPIAAHVSNYEISSSQMSEAGIDNVHTANAPKKIEACKQILLAYLQLQESQLVLEEATLHNSLVCEVDDLSTIKTQSCSDDFSVVLIASVGPVSMVSHVASSAIALEFGIFCPLEMPRGFHHRFALKLPNNHHYVVDIFQGTPQDSLKISFMDLTESLKRSTELSIEELQQSVWFVCDDTASKVAACREHVLKLLSESDAKEELLLSEPSFEKELVIVSCLGPVSSLFHLVNTSSVCPVAFLPVANVISQHHRFVVKTPLHHYIVDMLEDWREDKLLLRYMDPISSRASSYEVSSSQLRVAGIQDASSATPAQKIEACKQILLAYLTMDKSGFQLECILKVIDKRYLVTACEAPAGCFFMTYTEPLSSCVKNILVTAEERQFLGVEDWSSCNRESIKEACHIMLMNVRMSELMLMWRGVVPVGSCRLLVQLIESAEASQDAEAYCTFYITTKWFDPLSGRSGELKVFDIDFREQGYLCDLLLVPSMVKIDTCISKLAEHALWEQIHMHQSDTESASERGSLFKDAPDLVVDKGRFVPVDFSVVLVASVGTISMVNHHISAATPMDFGGTCPLEIARGFHQRIALKAPNNDHYVVDISEGSRENSIKISFMDATHCHCESIDLTIEELKDIVNIHCDDTASKVAACRKYVLWVLARNENTEASPLYDSDLRTEMCVAPCLGPISFANHFIHASRVLSLAHIPVANLVSYHHRFALKAPLNYYVVDMLENWKEANILLRYIDPISSRLSSYEISSLEMLEAGIHDVSTANTAQKVGACKQILLAYLKGNQRSDLEEASVHGSLGGEVAELENEENSLISDDFSVVLISSVGVVSMINHQASTATIMDFGELSPLEIARGFHRRIALKAPNNHHYVVDISEGTKENSLHICFMRTAQSQVESVVLSIDELRESGRFLCDDTASKVAACREYVLCLLARKEHKEDPPLSDSGLDIEVFVASSLGPISSVNHFIHPTRVLSLSNVSVANVISYHHRFALNAPLHYYIVDMLEHWKETNILLRYIDPISSRLSSYEVSSLEMHEAGIPDVSAVSTAQKVDACKQILLAYLKCNEHSDLEEASVHGFMAGEAAELENEESSLITEDFSVVLIASVGVVSMVNNQPSTATTVDFGDLSPLEIARAFHRRIALKASNNHHYVVDISEGTRVDSLQINFTETTQSQMESVELSTDELQDFVHFLCDDTASKVAACREYVLWHLARSNKEEPELTYDNLDGGKNVTPCLGPISYLNHFICPARVFSLARVSVANIVSQHHRFALKAPLNYYIVDMLENWKEANIMLRYIDPISSRLKSYEVSSLEMREAGISDISTVNTAQKVDACKQILLAYLKNERCFGASAFQLKCILKVIDKRYLVSACEASDGGFFIKYTDPLRTCLKQHLVHAEEKQVLGISGWSASERDSIKEACHVLLMNIRMSELMLVWRGVVPVGGRRLLVQLIESSEPSQDVQGAFYITTKWYDPLSRGSGQLQVFDKEFRELGYLCDLLLVPSPGKIETCISKLNEQALWQQLQECHSDLEEASVHGSLGGESAALEIEESSVFAEDFSVVLIASVGVVSMVNHQTNTATVVDFGQLLSLEMARGFHHRLALKAQNNQYYVVDISEGESEASLKISYMGATKSELESTELSIKELQESGNFSCHDTASKIAACCEHVRKLLARNEPIDKASLCDSDSEAEVFVAPCLGPVSLLNHFMNPARVISFFHLSVANVISQHHRFALKAPRHYYIVDMLENWKEGEILLRYTDPISSRLSGYEVSFSQMTEAGIDDVSSANASQKVEACKQILLAYLKGFNCFGGSAFQLKCVLKVIDKRFLVSACEASDGGFSIKYTDALTSCLKQIFVHAEEKKFLGVDGWSACEMDSIKEACHVVLMNARMSELMLVWRGVVLVGGRRLLVQLNESAQPSQDAQGTFYITTKWYDPLSRGSGELQVFDKEFRVLGYLCDLLLVPSQVKIEACVSKLVEQELWKQLQGCRSDLEEASLQSSLDGESAELYTEERLPLAEDFHVVLIASVGAISMVNHLASTTTIMDFGELSLLEIAREFHHRFAVKAPDNQHYIVDISEGTRKDCLKISFMGTTQSQLESMELSIDELRESENFVCDDTASKVCACREYVLKLLARNQHIEKPSLPDSDSEATLFAAPSFGALSFLNYYINLARSVPLPSLAVANVISRHHRFALKAPLHYYIVDMLENQEEGEILLRYMDPISSRLSSYEVSSLQLSAAGINDICSADAVQKVDACKQILLAYLKGDHRFGARAFQVKCILKVIDKRYLVSAYEASAGGFSIKYTDPLSSCIKHISVCAEQKKLLGVDAWSACEGDCIKEACLVILMNARMSELMLMWRGVVPVGGRRLLVQLIESSEPIQGMQGTFYITLKWYDPLSCGSGELQVFDQDFRELGYLCDLLLVPIPVKIETCTSKLVEQQLWQQLQVVHSDLDEVSVHGSLCGELAELGIVGSSLPLRIFLWFLLPLWEKFLWEATK